MKILAIQPPLEAGEVRFAHLIGRQFKFLFPENPVCHDAVPPATGLRSRLAPQGADNLEKSTEPAAIST